MSPPTVWGPPTWRIIHTLACKVKEDRFQEIGPTLVSFIIQICHNLPCPECAQHAREFWKTVPSAVTEQKQTLINVLYMFHNKVNQRRNIPLFRYEDLPKYRGIKLIPCYNNFVKNFVTRGNIHLLTESFRRSLMMQEFRKWLFINLVHFDLE